MTYLNATGQYESDFLEKILDTDFRYGVPYKIDREKYENVLKEYNQIVRMTDSDVAIFEGGYSEEKDDKGKTIGIDYYCFYAWPQNSPKGSDEYYENVQFWSEDYDNKHKEAFEEFVRKMLKCIIEPDEEHVRKLILELRDEVALKQTNIDTLNNLIDIK